MSGIRVVVDPATFTLVEYDATEIQALVAAAGSWIGLGDSDEVRVRIDEGSPLARVTLESLDPIVLFVEGGAIEDVKRIRKLDPDAVQTVAVRMLARVADRRRADFAGAPDEAALAVAELDCWDAWALGRASRHGLRVPQMRWRYRFRNHHGFTDTADAVFDRLWAADDLGWADIEAACAETEAVRPVVDA
ncbi:MAG: hypothetical protein ACYDH6_14040 [Acidimicrobiales bacterium]